MRLAQSMTGQPIDLMLLSYLVSTDTRSKLCRLGCRFESAGGKLKYYSCKQTYYLEVSSLDGVREKLSFTPSVTKAKQSGSLKLKLDY